MPIYYDLYNIYLLTKVNNQISKPIPMIYQSQDQQNQNQYQIDKQPQQDQFPKQNLFMLTDEQKNNINKKLPRGFCLIRKQDYERLGYWKKPVLQEIQYEPVKIKREIDLENPIYKTIRELWIKKQEEVKKSNRLALQTNFQGRSRQSQKIKNIIQRFRKLLKNTQVQSYFNRVGLMNGINQIQGENKKGLLTIDTFKIRYMLILQAAKSNTFQTQVITQLDQMIQQFLCYVEQARKTQFQNNLISIQKSIDKITRYLSDADAKTQGNWYIRKRKKGDRTQVYNDKQTLYIADLIKKLPTAYLVGVWEIINDRPFTQAEKKIETVNLAQIDFKKMKDIEVYVRNKLSQLYRSRERKKQKIAQKRSQKMQNQQNINAPINTNTNANTNIVKEQVVAQKHFSLDDEINQIFGNDDDNQFIEPQKQTKQRRIGFADQNQFQPIFKDENVSLKQSKNQDKKNKGQPENAQVKKNDDDNDSMDIDNSSDSSMITDEDDSDF